MSSQKVSTLGALAIPSDDDLVMMVDVSDTSMSASGTNKKSIVGNLIRTCIEAPTVVDITAGDLLWLDTVTAKPASLQEDQGTELANQAEFATRFLGIALNTASSGDMVSVLTYGVIEFDCIENTFNIGDLVGAKENGGTTLLDQTVVKVSTPQHAIGRVAEYHGTNTTKVSVAFLSKVMFGGVVGTTFSGA